MPVAATIIEAATDAATSDAAPAWVNALSQFVVSVAAALVIATIVWGVRRIAQLHARFEAVEHKLESVDHAVNQTEGRTLTERVDCILRAVEKAAEERAEIAGRVEVVEGALGEHPPLSREQARAIARARLDTERDTTEEHP